MFGWFRKRDPAVGGEIAYHGLSEWWLHEFSNAERQIIRDTYQPMGAERYVIDRGNIGGSTQDTLSFVSGVAAWFAKEETRHIGFKFLLKADEFISTDMHVLSKHFAMQLRCQAFYRWRDHDELALREAVISCERGIALSKDAAQAFREAWGDPIPGHYCFKQLAIIEEKADNLDRAIALCDMAEGDGWRGDWEKRRDRLRAKLNKQHGL